MNMNEQCVGKVRRGVGDKGHGDVSPGNWGGRCREYEREVGTRREVERSLSEVRCVERKVARREMVKEGE